MPNCQSLNNVTKSQENNGVDTLHTVRVSEINKHIFYTSFYIQQSGMKIVLCLNHIFFVSSLSLRSPRPTWTDFMQMIHKGNHPGQASVMFLPMIDVKPTDMSCITVNSIPHFVSKHARHYGVTPVLTIDQPLWWKATTIVEGAHEDSPLR